MADDDSSVRVAVRIRPQIARELIDMCRVCTSVTPGEPQVTLGSDKAFTYDFVFDMNSSQNDIYDKCVANLVDGSLEGYNATVLAYGQTGSGKTYTMGTGFEVADPDPDFVGIIPRALHHLFSGIDQKVANAREMGQPPPEFKLVAQFMELYNEEVIDLFDTAREQLKPKSGIKIHEDAGGGIYVVGVTMRPIASVQDALECLRAGALSRTTASTQMNTQSSRSHAIFTLHIKQQRLVKIEDLENSGLAVDGESNGGSEFETLSAKFHFVDLAGSERLKRTGATGERAREGISINCGLLALGNVISALGDKSKRATHVPYRDSKLTRLLQDSLGGNSQTVMIACVSPSDQDFMETLNTLKYANRARNIKNRVMINQDKSSRTISLLRQEIQQLQLELLEYKQGKRIVGDDGTETINDMFHENTMLQTEIGNLRTRVKAMQETVDALTMKNTQLLAERATSKWIGTGDVVESDVAEILQGYLKEIEQLRAKLLESEALCTQLRKTPPRLQGNPVRLSLAGQMDMSLLGGGDSSTNVLEEARRDLAKDLEILHSKSGASINSKTDEKSSSLADEACANDDDNTDSDSNESLDSDTDSEEKETEGKIGLQIAELTSEITVKQKLIEELEMSQRRLNTMRQHYEDKLLQLEERIRATQNERDKVLASINLQHKAPPDKIKKVRDEYEKKLTDMQKELRRLQTAQKEHGRLLRNQSQHENQLRQLKTDLDEMKRAKVKLMTRMREESSKHKQVELRRAREIAQLRKETRRRDNQIRSLEAEKRAKEVVLRRKQEEVSALRRQARGALSRKAAGRVLTPTNNPAVVADLKKRSSPAQCKHKWQTLENNINKISLNKHTIATLERDMERHLKERESYSHTLEQLIKKRDRALLNRREDVVRDLDDQIESMQTTIEFIQDSIGEAQKNIIQIEESKESFDSIGVSKIVANLEDIAEARYLIEKLYNMTVNQCYTAAQKELEVKELEAKFNQITQESRVERQLLQHVLTTSELNDVGLLMDSESRNPTNNSTSLGTILGPTSISSSKTSGLNEVGAGAISPSSTGSEQSSRSVSPTYNDNGANGNGDTTFIKPQFTRREHKLRRRTAVPEDLLYPTSGAYPGAPGHEDAPEDTTNHNNTNLKRLHATPASLKLQSRVEACRSPGAVRKPFLTPTSSLINNSEMTSPKVTRRPLHGSLDQGLDTSPPGSPPSYRRQSSREENVFSRLTSSTNIGVEQPVGQGVIHQYNGKVLPKAPLICTHVAEGHSRAVLALDATDHLLFTASKDRTVKVWDLETGHERDTLRVHPNNVVAVHYDETTGLVFSTSACYVKVWDLRSSVSKCIKTLSSSGVTTTVPTTHTPVGESLLTAVALNPSGTTLYTATGDRVRVWDLRKFETCAKLSGGHQAAIMCLAVNRISDTEDLVITGSKDHYIKVFEVNGNEMSSGAAGMAVFPPKMNLNPPHYDGIQSLAISNDTLFSGSRDTCIKKWNLSRQELVTSMNNAHKDWVCGLTLMQEGRMLVSACRAGFVKLWSADSCQCLATIKAHSSPINAVKANRTGILFTAGNDGNVRFWRLNSRRFDSSLSSSPVDVANTTFLVAPPSNFSSSSSSSSSSSNSYNFTSDMTTMIPTSTSTTTNTSGLRVLRRLLSAPNDDTNGILPY